MERQRRQIEQGNDLRALPQKKMTSLPPLPQAQMPPSTAMDYSHV